jgi:hypothetical protein
MLLILPALLAACVVALVMRRWSPRPLAALDGPYTPAIVGVVWAMLPALAWRGAQPLPVFHDEAAYLLQAQIFARGRWSSPAPPVPELFGQAHVLVTPVLAAKYPPGHSLLLAIGALLGAPALIVFLLNALRVGLVFALARRLSDAATALMTVVLLYFTEAQLSSSYFSELTSGATLVAAWYGLWRWRADRRRRWLLLVALSLGWCAITRPWSALAFALPIGVVVLRDVWQTRRWRDLVAAMVLGACVVSILPLWAWGTLGDWRRTPQLEYTRDYMPFDFPHFGVVNAKPRLTPPPDVAAVNAMLLDVEKQHTLKNIGHDARLRADYLFDSAFPDPKPLFAVFLAVGFLVVPVAGWLGVATLLCTFVAYLAHPTWPWWTVYLFEVTPVLTFLSALGIAAVLRIASGEWKGRRLPAAPLMPRAALGVLTGCVLLTPALLITVAHTRAWFMNSTAERRELEAVVAQLPRLPAIVFVRYGPNHSPHFSLTANSADWQNAPAWIVYDLGEASKKLMELAPERQPYVFDEAHGRVFALPRSASDEARLTSRDDRR